jgi:hypothetical protein
MDPKRFVAELAEFVASGNTAARVGVGQGDDRPDLKAGQDPAGYKRRAETG